MKTDRTAIDQRLQFLADKLNKLKTDDEYRSFLIAFYVDRAKFNKCTIPDNYTLVSELEPKLVNRKLGKLQFLVSDCGLLVYKWHS